MSILIPDADPVSVQLAEVRTLCAIGRARAIREDAGLTLADLARDVHVSTSTIARWETAEARPTGAVALSYLRLLRRLEQRSRPRFGRV
jgi:DNA-binding transcriptional regulator YiaG